MDVIREAGWPIFPILAFGLASLVAGWRYARSGRRELVPLVVGLGAATLLLGIIGTALGVQLSASHIGQVPPADRWIFLIGLKESLHNLTVAATFALGDVVLLMTGARAAMQSSPPLR
jgi:hypothetical protein